MGQRQLVSLLRVLVQKPAIFILDEATANLDPESEAQVQEAIARLLVGRTALIIAHRLSTIQHCDRILVLHKGEVIEEGTHSALLEEKGIYHKLYQLQYRDEVPMKSIG